MTLSSAILKDNSFIIDLVICGDLSLCNGIQDLYVIVKNLGYVPGIDPQWGRGRITFTRFLPFCIGSYRIECGEARCFRARKVRFITSTHLCHHFQGHTKMKMLSQKRSEMAAFLIFEFVNVAIWHS